MFERPHAHKRKDAPTTDAGRPAKHTSHSRSPRLSGQVVGLTLARHDHIQGLRASQLPFTKGILIVPSPATPYKGTAIGVLDYCSRLAPALRDTSDANFPTSYVGCKFELSSLRAGGSGGDYNHALRSTLSERPDNMLHSAWLWAPPLPPARSDDSSNLHPT
ncbi:hypothetical protein HYH02_012918 [Chlamydomonas schloesseri]|uniref:Uncharacterized protein n=1 Tax=Chlamydomonas schloesseri TaxID=2026947 RepID=A0A835SSZ3_9CHLO|nr:hypothetical protein HYH02_012918 [Chlamydomonas schloesseri]|eukprot:KAG2432787.1 hypothetical protein HYH02_012918 [Chlamydomonas schloesseri]